LYTPDLEDCSLTFKRDRSGKANGIIVQMNDREIRGVRVSDDPSCRSINPGLRRRAGVRERRRELSAETI
jgi:predicted secreted Zn-dependent protease